MVVFVIYGMLMAVCALTTSANAAVLTAMFYAGVAVVVSRQEAVMPILGAPLYRFKWSEHAERSFAGAFHKGTVGYRRSRVGWFTNVVLAYAQQPIPYLL